MDGGFILEVVVFIVILYILLKPYNYSNYGPDGQPLDRGVRRPVDKPVQSVEDSLQEISEYGKDHWFPIENVIPGTAARIRKRAYHNKVYSGGIALPDDIVPCDVVYKNIAEGVSSPLEWWVCERADLPTPSPAEALIIAELDKYRCKWYREVSFKGLQVKSYSYPRYDILIVNPHTTSGIHIVEYDSKLWHVSAESKAMDKLKNKFCHSNGIPITRYSTKDYYHIPVRVEELMYHLHIERK